MIDYIEYKDIDIAYIIAALEDQKREKGFSQNARARKRTYKDCLCAFDIETTTIDEIEQSIMYIWQFQLDDLTIIGRTWTEFRDLCEKAASVLEDDTYIVVYVHNLSFEFQWLSSVFAESLDNIFCMDARKVLKFDILNHIEFRCSYLHSNMSLGEYTRKMQVKDFKLSGDTFDYSIKRYPWTPLSDFKDYEIRYVINDVKGLVEAIRIEMAMYGDNLYSFPLTSTGYVRRDTKHVLGKYKDKIRQLLPDIELMRALRDAFRGGDTHANRYYSGQVINNRIIHSVDESSAYPSVILGHKYPMTEFIKVRNTDYSRIYKFIQSGRYAYVLKVVLYDVRLRDRFWGCPYIPRAKASGIIGGVYDNGRVLKAERLMITITDIDLRILLQEYDFDLEVLEAWKSKYGDLPYEYRDLVLGYYERKTKLKGDKENEVYYGKTKALLNSLYGMMAQNPLKEEIVYVGNEFLIEDKSEEELLRNYNRTAFLCYQWGVWVTAYARQALHNGIHHVVDNGGEFLYCDTDSIKYYGEVDFTGINDELKSRMPYAEDNKGKRHYLGVWEPEEDMSEFITLGAKKYADRTLDGKLHVTIAGVGKRKGAEELERAGGLDAFRIGFRFDEAGGSEVIYNDEDYGVYYIDGHYINIRKNIVIKPSFYTLGITNEYFDTIRAVGIDPLYFTNDI